MEYIIVVEKQRQLVLGSEFAIQEEGIDLSDDGISVP
jgi:hypothetical protein